MSYFHRPDAGFERPVTTEDPPRSPFSDVAGRFANWITGADRMPGEGTEDVYDHDDDPIQQLTAGPVSEEPSRFPVAPLGYSRAAVDEHLFGLERELAELRAQRQPALSITEELERIGEQTASILVVAHDQAHATTRQAQEQAERCMADAAANAETITAQAKQRLRELDGETDSVWRERERLLEDVRVVSAALAALADQAAERFPAADPGPASAGMMGFHMAPEAGATEAFTPASEPPEPPEPSQPPKPAPEPASERLASDSSAPPYGPWAGEAFRMQSPASPWSSPEPSRSEAAHHSPAPGPQSGDTGSWLAGLEPPDQS
jgi:DivIVA protein